MYYTNCVKRFSKHLTSVLQKASKDKVRVKRSSLKRIGMAVCLIDDQEPKTQSDCPLWFRSELRRWEEMEFKRAVLFQ